MADSRDSAASCGAPGSLDPSFGAGGFAPVALGVLSVATSVVSEPTTGRLLVSATSSADRYRCTVFRLGSDGQLDATYGTDGVTRVAVAAYSCDLNDIALQSTGKLVGVGEISDADGGYPVLLRFAPDGSLDTTFGTDGVVLPQPGMYGQLAGVVIDSQDRIVAAMEAADDLSSTSTHFAVVRYTPDGALDLTFGTGGVALDAFHDGQDLTYDVVLQGDGKIVAAGIAATSTASDFGIARYQPNGSLDTSFGSGGTATAMFQGGAVATGLAVDPANGTIVVGDIAGAQGGAVRWTVDGVLDPQFADAGRLATHVSGNGISFRKAALDGNGNVLITGWWNDSASTSLVLLAKLDAMGRFDPTFGTNGFSRSSSGATYNTGWNLVQQQDGKTVVVGSRGDTPWALDVLVARFCP